MPRVVLRKKGGVSDGKAKRKMEHRPKGGKSLEACSPERLGEEMMIEIKKHGKNAVRENGILVRDAEVGS